MQQLNTTPESRMWARNRVPVSVNPQIGELALPSKTMTTVAEGVRF